MNLQTIQILNTYSNHITKLDLSNKNIRGILNLKRFTNLTHLNCSFNQINRIIGLSTTIVKIICSNNKIDNLSGFEYLFKLVYLI